MAKLARIAEEVVGKPVESSAPLMASGLDSLAAIELKNAVSIKFGVTLPATLAFDYPTLEALATYVVATKVLAHQLDHGRYLCYDTASNCKIKQSMFI